MDCMPMILLCGALAAASGPPAIVADSGVPDALNVPPLETFVLEPMCVDHVSLWVPADKTGPVINRGCQPQRNCLYSCLLPARVWHDKGELCPPDVARLLAEYTSRYHERTLPLTIFNGWQWEYSYSLCQFDAMQYTLAPRGGSWENSVEAVLTRSMGRIIGTWLQPAATGGAEPNAGVGTLQSHIEVTTFDAMRVRNGYPKKRQL